jgi:diguanylate cyclase (GGDEF)-like protein/PAS domain S-box-containing protein
MKNKNRANSKKNSPQQKNELQDIFENALECVARLDVSGSFLSVNSNFAQTYAYQAEEMVGMLCRETVHADDATVFEEAYQQMLEQGRAEIDVRGIKKDSTVFYKHIVMVKGLSDNKSAIAHYCFIQDITERILSQRALRDQAELQSEQFHSLIENIQGVVYRCNSRDWEFEYLSENILEMLGISKNEIPKNARTLFTKYTHKQDVKRLIEIIRLEVPEDGKYEIEYRVFCKDGSIKWLQNRATGIFNDEQKLTYIDGVILDITQQKQVERELVASELLLTTAIETSPTVICISRIDDGKILKVNRSFESAFGYTREEILYTSAIDLWPDTKERDKLVKVLREKGKLDNFECSFKHKDGHIATALMSAHIIEVDGESCMFSAGHDISERIRAEISLRKSEEMYANAINLNPDAIYLTRLSDGLIIDVNEGFFIATGYSREEVIGKTTIELNLWPDINDREKFVSLVRSDDKVKDLEIKYRKKNKELSVAIISSVMIDVDGEPSTFTIAHSIDERIKAEQVLRASEEKFSAAIDVSPDGVVVTRLSDGMIKDINQSAIELSGYSREEILGKTMLEMGFYNAKDRQVVVERLQKDGRYSDMESTMQRKDGTMITTLSSAVVLKMQGESCIFAIIHDISQRKKEEDNLLQISKGVSAKIGEQFFTSLVEHLAQSLEVEYALVGKVTRGNKNKIATISVFSGGQAGDNFEYNLKNAPCEMVFGKDKDIHIFPEHIQHLFPKDKMLVEMQAEGYAGAPLVGSSDEILGLIVVVGKKPLKNTERILSTLKIFAARAAAELERMQSNKELMTSEENFRRAIFSTPDCITLVTVEDGILFEVNEGFCDISGYSREEVLGKSIINYWLQPEEREYFVKKLQQEGFVKGFQHTFLGKGGKHIVGSISSVIIDYQGSPCIFSVTHDITHIKEAERALTASEEKFRSAFGNAPIGVALLDINGKIIQVNKIVTDILGYEEKDLMGKTISDITLQDDVDESLCQFNKLTAGEITSYELEKRYKAKSKAPIWTQIHVASIRNEEGGFLYAVVHVINISERKLSAARLDRTNRALRVLNECNYGLTHITDEQNLLQYICEVIINIGGYRFSWVGYAKDDKQKTVQPMAKAGFEEGYLENVILWADKPRGRGPTGNCIRTNSRQICRNIAKDPAFKPWRKTALARNYQSSVALPLIIDSKTIGALNIYSSEIEVFDTDEVKLLSNLAENLAFGIRSARFKKESRIADLVLRNSEEKFRSTFGHAPVGMVMVNSEGTLIEVNKAALKLSGLSKKEMVGSSIAAITHPEDIEKSMKYFKDLWSGKMESYQIEKRYLHKDGHTIHCILHGSLVRDENNNPLFMVGQVEDITAKKHLNDVLTASEAKFKMLYHDTPAMFINVDLSGFILSVNDYGAKQLGYTVDELIGVDVASLIHEEDRSSARDHLKHCIDHPEQVCRWEIRKRKKDGEVIWVRESVRVVSDYHDGAVTFFIVCEDITETYRLSQQLSYQATHDSLTGLVNRAEFERRLQRVLKINDPKITEHAICYLDLDQFKIINDTCGHLAGDELLRQLSELLFAKVRKRDTLARLGGDEFGVLMEHCDLNHARRVANSLRAMVEDFRFVWQDKKFSIGVSIGLVPINVSSGNVNDILSAADAACYAAKDAGRNRIHVYASDDKSMAIRRGEMQWVSRINHALEEGLFKLYYQKIISVNGLKQGDHYELLLRMTGSNGELIPPGAFLSAAERYGLSNKIDSWVVNKAFTWLASHPAKLKKLHICAINLSGQSLGNEEFMQNLLNDLDESGIPANKICFEITETAAIANLASAIRFINKFRSKGCLFALDDFGSGVSSFGYLKNLPVDYLKIDGSFVRDIANDRIDRAMVKSINEIGQIMGKQTIAEFVENDVILKELKKLGVDYAQGYGIGKPRPLYYSKKR